MGVTWDRGPTAEDVAEAYPDRALKIGMSGRVELACQISFIGRLTCKVAKETPSGWGFGKAARKLAQETIWAAPRLADGSPSANEEVLVPIEFRTE